MRTVTYRVDAVRAGMLLLVNNRLAEICEVQTAIELGPLGIDGPIHEPKPYYWVELGFTWVQFARAVDTEPASTSPISHLTIEGNRWIEIREEGN